MGVWLPRKFRSMAAASFFPFVALYFLSHPAVSAHDSSNNNIKISCPESAPCGNSGPLLYFPFSNVTNPQCGLCSVFCSDREHHEGEITCGNETFQITNISSTPRGYGSVKVHEPDFRKRSLAGTCSDFRNFSLPNPLSISFTIPHNLTLFKCRKSSLPSPPAHDEYFNYTGCDDFYLYYKHPLDDHRNVSASADSFHGCDTIQLPLTSGPYKRKTKPGEDDTEPGENDDDLLKLLTGTYYIELQASEDCLKCHGRGGLCQTTINQKFHCKAKKNGTSLQHLHMNLAAMPAVTSLYSAVSWCLFLPKSLS